MPTSDFLPFAGASGANVLTQAAWVADTADTTLGFSAGILPSAKLNKALRQNSAITAALAQVVCNLLAANVPDDGNAANLQAQILQALSILGSQTQIFNTSGTFVVPAGVTMIKVRVVGAGGGGSECNSVGGSTSPNSGGGGGAGGYCERNVATTPGASETIIVGVGGVSQNAGTASSAFGLLANGGAGSLFQTGGNSAGGAGGTASGGTVNVTGGYGSDGQAGLSNFAGNGAPGPFGGGGRAGSSGGFPGVAPGAGGGGAYDALARSTLYSGGTGAAGVVILEY